MTKQYLIRQAFKETRTGNIVPDGWDLFAIDAGMTRENWCQRFYYKKDAKAAMEVAVAEDAAPASRPAYYDFEGGSMCNGIGRSYF